MPPNILFGGDFNDFELDQGGNRRVGRTGTPATRGSLGDIIDERFLGEFERLQTGQAGLESEFLEALRAPIDFDAFRGQLSTLAEGLTSELFGAGGAVELATRGAAGQSVQTGFGTTSGGFERARQNILTGARDQLTSGLAQGAIQLGEQAIQSRAIDLGSLGQFVSGQAGRLDELRESIFGGQATIEQLKLAQETQEQNRRLIEEALGRGDGSILDRLGGAAGGALSGAAAASFIPGIGTVTGGILGGITGLFS